LLGEVFNPSRMDYLLLEIDHIGFQLLLGMKNVVEDKFVQGFKMFLEVLYIMLKYKH
jgi:hypothetical protein